FLLNIHSRNPAYIMLTQRYSSVPCAELLSQDSTLVVMPLSGRCERTEPGLIYTGIDSCPEHSEPPEHSESPEHSPPLNELWQVEGPVVRGRSEHCDWSKNADVMCVARWLDESECDDIEASTRRAYLSIMSVLKAHGFAHLFRCWNYLPSINEGEGDEEVYKRFCAGRLAAFEALGIAPSQFPAASALGHHGRGAVIYVFASHSAPQHFKNTKQVNAYEYPRQYGIGSPSFARATALSLASMGGDESSTHLFISGTASIVGHETVSVGDVQGQLHVTGDNIAHLLAHANPDNKRLSALKVYVRHQAHVSEVEQWLNKQYAGVDRVITLADVCRSDLLVEIECVCQ
ncbi:hypothetical protein ACFO4O_16700, partial [Glaciecola siphonariae]